MEPQMEAKKFKFRDTKDNAGIVGRDVEYSVPRFDWEVGIRSPITRQFLEQAYGKQLQKLVREIEKGGLNGTSVQDIGSMESVMLRSLNYSSSEIRGWVRSRDPNSISTIDPMKTLATMEKLLTELCNGNKWWGEEVDRRLIDHVADAADREQDPIADYLVEKLSEPGQEYALAEL